ncbi:Uncharacterised protein [Mycobacterium tuberculosis]|nr:Uncharacterised protein [Mycobacterium tuberculosis]
MAGLDAGTARCRAGVGSARGGGARSGRAGHPGRGAADRSGGAGRTGCGDRAARWRRSARRVPLRRSAYPGAGPRGRPAAAARARSHRGGDRACGRRPGRRRGRGRGGRGRAFPAACAGRGGAAARRRQSARRRPRQGLPGTAVRVGGSGGAAQRAGRGDRSGPAGHPRLRLPDRAPRRRVPAAARLRRRPRRGRPRGVRAGPEPAPRGAGRRGPDRDRRHGLPVPGRRRLAGGVLDTDRRRTRRHRPVPGGPRLEHGGALRPRGPDHLYAGGRLRRRRDRLRRGLLRHLPARGADDGPAAAAAAGDLVAGGGARGHRSGEPARLAHRRVRGPDVPRLRAAAGRDAGPCRRLRRSRCRGQRRVRPGGLSPGPDRPRRDGGHGVLLLAGRPALGRAGAAQRRVLDGAGRRRHGDVHARGVRRLRPAGRPRGGRPVQVLLRCG